MLSNALIFKSILEQFPDGIIVIDGDGKITFLNKSAEDIRRVTADSLIGNHIVSCHPPHSREKVERALAYLRTKSNSFHRMVVDHSAGCFFENTYCAIRSSSNEFLGYLVVTKDITDKHKAEENNIKLLQNQKDQIALLTENLNKLFISSLTCLVNTLEAKDPYTKGHSLRVTDISKKIVEQVYGLSLLLNEIEIAGQLHDIGKIGIRESVLNKPEKLTQNEFEHMKQHVLYTDKILEPIDRMKPISRITRHHHERFDGKGYPDRLTGEDIPIGSRILSIADTFDAMTSSRPYRKAMDPESSITEIERCSGSQFDPKLAKAFIDLYKSGTI